MCVIDCMWAARRRLHAQVHACSNYTCVHTLHVRVHMHTCVHTGKRACTHVSGVGQNKGLVSCSKT